MGIIEKYSRATQSSNLKCDEHHFDTDSLAAVAWSGKLGTKLFRIKYANDVSSYSTLLPEWEAVVAVKSILRCWPQHAGPVRIARLALNHWLNDLCPACGGKGVQPHPEIPQVLSDDPCVECGGTGVARPVCEKRDRQYVEDMIELLHEMVRHAASQAMRKLANDMDL